MSRYAHIALMQKKPQLLCVITGREEEELKEWQPEHDGQMQGWH